MSQDVRVLKDEVSKIIDLLSKQESKAKHLEREIEVARISALDEPKVMRLLAPTATE